MGSPALASTYKLARSLWPQKSIYDLILNQQVVLSDLPKDTSFYEAVRYIAVGYSAPQGIGPNFTTAKANKTASKAQEFQLSTYIYYATFSIEGRLMRRAKSDKALIVKPLARETKNALTQWRRDVTAFMHGNGGGAIGKIASAGVSGQNITLDDITKIRFFDIGMKLNSATTDGTSGTVNPGSVTVAKVNRRTGVITVAEASVVAGIPAAAAADFLFRDGVFGNVTDGFESWIPATDPTSTLFKAVDRSVDTEGLGGIRLDVSAKTPFNGAMALAGAVHDAGGSPDRYIVTTTDWQNLRAELSSAGSLTYTQIPSAAIGKFVPGMKYTAIEIMGPSGPIAVLPDPDATASVGRMHTRETWTLGSMGELIAMIDETMMEDAADSFESRFVGDLELYCEAPKYNARGAL